MRPRRFPIRFKLTLGILVPLFATIAVCWVTGVSIINSRIFAQAQDKVKTDLTAALEIYGYEVDHVKDVIRFSAQSAYTATAVADGSAPELSRLLTPLLHNEHLDFLYAVDPYGRVLFRAGNPSASGDRVNESLLAGGALAGKIVGGSLVLPYEQVLRENPALEKRVTIPVRSTPRARLYVKKEERAGLFLVAAAPVKNERGEVVGALCGGTLLNGDNRLVDRIKRIVYEGDLFEGKNVGTATIFLGDIRIATNVIGPDGTRALGTLMSEEVYNRVILKGERWIDRAFVVNDWFFSAYGPITDLAGNTVGSLYVGIMEKPYTALRGRVKLIFASVLLAGSMLGFVISGFIGGHLARPIRELETFARRVAVGERDLRMEVKTADELGALAAEFNDMTSALAQREADIINLNRSLEQKVEERTAQVEEKGRLLMAAKEELARAEKLADLGVVAAGVAHEMNNPLAIIRGNTEVLELYIPEGGEGRTEIGIIARQTERMARIVANLLTFARQKPMQRKDVPLAPILDEIIQQAGNQVDMARIRVERRYDPELPPITGDPDKLRQVFTNLIVNAVQAMAGSGVLTVTTGRAGQEGMCEITVGDTGDGIQPEHVGKVFTPFFTTRENGTGLGLAVSYGIVKDHGGTITVESTPGEGTVFRVLLPMGK